MKNLLFVGSYLSKEYGSKPVSQSISEFLEGEFRVELRSRFSNKFLRALDIFRAIAFHDYAVVHFDIFSGKAVSIARAGALLARLRNRRIIFSLHGGGLADYHSNFPVRLEKTLALADVLLTPSMFIKKHFEDSGFLVEYFPNPIRLENFTFNPVEQNEHRLLWVRAFAPTYRPQLAIEILDSVLKAYPDSTLTMIGPDHGELSSCIDLAASLGVSDRVRILGPVDNSELHQHYCGHDIYLNTTRYESFGMALMEAAACGLPIVSSKVGEIPLLWVDGREIILCSGEVAADYVGGICRIFEEAEFASSMVHLARRKAEQYSWTSVGPQWRALLERMS